MNSNSNIDKQNKFKGNIMSFSLQHQDAIPVFVEKAGKEYIYFGLQNTYPNFLIELANSSALHGAIVKSVARQVAGTGIRIKGNITDPKLQQYIDVCNGSGESLYEVIKKVIIDYIIFGGFSFAPIWQKSGQMFDLYHCDLSTIRSGFADKATGRVNEYFVSDDWSKQSKLKYEKYPAFDIENRTGTQIKYCKFYSPGSLYYPNPEYINIIYWATADFKISEFHNSNLDNQFTPSLLLNFNNGIPTQEEQQALYNDMLAQFTSSKNAGKILCNFNEGKDTAMEVTVLSPNSSDKQYLDLQHIILTQILAGHGIVNPELVGISTAGKLGNADYIESWQLFNKTVIEPKQREIEREINLLLSYIGFTNKIEIEPMQPISFALPPNNMEKICTINELRALVNRLPIEGGDVIVEPRVISEIGVGSAPVEIKAPDPKPENETDANPDMSVTYKNRTILNDLYKTN